MGKIVDMLDISLEELIEDGSKILDEEFMTGLFDEIKNTVPPFMDYYKHMYKQKAIKPISPRETKVIPLVILKKELFSTTSEINKQIIQTTSSFGSIAAAVLLKELRDPKKATSDYLTRTEEKFSWGETSQNIHKDGLGMIAVNDPAESSFGATTR